MTVVPLDGAGDYGVFINGLTLELKNVSSEVHYHGVLVVPLPF